MTAITEPRKARYPRRKPDGRHFFALRLEQDFAQHVIKAAHEAGVSQNTYLASLVKERLAQQHNTA